MTQALQTLRATPKLAARICPQCGAKFVPTHGRQRFCMNGQPVRRKSRHGVSLVSKLSPCKLAFEQTARTRGAVLEAFVLTWRQGKRGRTDTTAYALEQLSKLADEFLAQDRKTGRNAALVVADKAANDWNAVDYICKSN